MENVYILREREFVRLNESVYKIGRTDKTIKERLRKYPKGSEYITSNSVVDSKSIEKCLINFFKINFIQKIDYGVEYFEGDVNKMIELFEDIVENYPIYEIQYAKIIKDQNIISINNNKSNFNKTFGIKFMDNQVMLRSFYNDFSDKEISFKRFEKFFDYTAKRDNATGAKLCFAAVQRYIGTDKSNNSLSNNDSNDESDNIEYINDQYDNFNDGKDKARHKIIIDLINRLTDQNKKNYKIDDLINAEIDNEIYIGVIKDIKNSVYFSNEAENRALFFRSKGKKFIHFGDNKKGHVAYTRFFQTLFAGYGIALRSQQKRIKGTKERFYVRYLNVDPNFKKIADFKHKITNDIDIYKELFIPSKDNKKRIIIA